QPGKLLDVFRDVCQGTLTLAFKTFPGRLIVLKKARTCLTRHDRDPASQSNSQTSFRIFSRSAAGLQTDGLHIKQVVYFHTSLCLSPLVELVSLSTRADGSQDAVGSGFGLLQLFTGRADSSISQGEGS
uniref:Uncharacterized protein n=1 Tax=Cyprinus carpio carpio TaxID=630221 RepID=A0A9J8D4E7_CYPCA